MLACRQKHLNIDVLLCLSAELCDVMSAHAVYDADENPNKDQRGRKNPESRSATTQDVRSCCQCKQGAENMGKQQSCRGHAGAREGMQRQILPGARAESNCTKTPSPSVSKVGCENVLHSETGADLTPEPGRHRLSVPPVRGHSGRALRLYGRGVSRSRRALTPT
jgi:hypothetical protein